MKLIEPKEITLGELISSTVPLDDFTYWDVAVEYDSGDRVAINGDPKIVYESSSSANTGNPPESDDGTFWIEVGASNRWKAFDKFLADPVVHDDDIEYTFVLNGSISSIALFGLVAGEVTVKIYDPSDVLVFQKTTELTDTTDIIDWYSFYTFEGDYDQEVLIPDLPAYAGNKLIVTISGATGTEVGQIVAGKVWTIGETLANTEIGIQDFSFKERDEFGRATIVERDSFDTVDFNFVVNTKDVRRVKRLLNRLRATPCVYYISEDSISLGAFVYGYFPEFRIPLTVSVSFATLQVEGLT